MDRITQLQDEIQRVSLNPIYISQTNNEQLLTIMSSTIAYLTARSTFLQVSEEIPITKTRNPDKYDPPEVFEGTCRRPCSIFLPLNSITRQTTRRSSFKILSTRRSKSSISSSHYPSPNQKSSRSDIRNSSCKLCISNPGTGQPTSSLGTRNARRKRRIHPSCRPC
jgi:hypothetical protein